MQNRKEGKVESLTWLLLEEVLSTSETDAVVS